MRVQMRTSGQLSWGGRSGEWLIQMDLDAPTRLKDGYGPLSRLNRRNLGPPISLKSIKVICPRLHHIAALAESLSPVISGAYFVPRRMGELALDHVPIEAEFVEQSAGDCSESMCRLLVL